MHHHLTCVSHNAGERTQRIAIMLSLGVGVLLAFGKWAAYSFTGSTAILSDAAESVVHMVAVAFAAYSLWLSQQPPDETHLYGHEKISFFSAGFEGALIVLTGLFIIYESIEKAITGPEVSRLDIGTAISLAVTVINGVLGWYLIRTGRRQQSLILVANGKHVLTDCWTTVGVIIGLVLIWITGWMLFDPLVATLVALNILWSGAQLVRHSFHGLMDVRDPATDRTVRDVLDQWVTESGARYHGLRHRSAGNVIWVEVHVLLPGEQDLATAHAVVTELEQKIQQAFGRPSGVAVPSGEGAGTRVIVTTHLEPIEQHAEHHPSEGVEHNDPAVGSASHRSDVG